MDTKILVSLSHQVAMRRQMDIIANNIANMNTTAYKRESVMFNEYLSEVEGSLPDDFKKVSFVHEMGVARQMSNGELITTNNSLDIALEGDGMFKVEKTDGNIAYTRNGHFSLSPDNMIITSGGHQVLDTEDAPIQLPLNTQEFTIAEDGTVSDKQGAVLGTINVLEFQDYGAMKKIGDNLYSADEIGTPATNFRIAQGMLETSNVSPVLEITNMIQLSRAYASTSSLMDKVQQTTSDAINRIARFA